MKYKIGDRITTHLSLSIDGLPEYEGRAINETFAGRSGTIIDTRYDSGWLIEFDNVISWHGRNARSWSFREYDFSLEISLDRGALIEKYSID